MAKLMDCRRLNRGFPLAAAVWAVCGATVAFNGCSSPLSDSVDRDPLRETDRLIAQAVMEGSYRNDMFREPTVAESVHEMTRVDAGSDAPAVAPANTSTSGDPATIPAAAATTTAGASATPPAAPATRPDDIGLRSSALNEPEPVFNLSLQDAIARALKHSLAIKVEAYNPAIRETQIVQSEAIYDPTVFAQSQWQNTDEPILIPGSGLNGQSLQNQVGIKQLLPSGATAQLQSNIWYRSILPTSVNTFPSMYSSYTDSSGLTITQPLLRGFGAEVTEANIYLAQRDRRISLSTFKRQVISTVADVEAAYQNLVLARTVVDIQQRLLAATEDTYRRVYDRIKIDADKISLSQSRAAVEERRADLIRARVNLRNQSDTLKTLLNDPELSINGNALVNPTDRPTAEAMVISTADAIETALRQRTEIQEARLQVERANIVVRVAKNDLLPKLDLTVGTQTNSLDDNFDQAFASTVSSGQHIDYSAGIRLEFALGNRQAESTLHQRKLERSQAMMQVVNIAQKVVQDVKVQLRDMLSSHVEIEAREAARVRAAEELEAITQKEKIVVLSPEFLQLKLDSQSRLATAEQNLIQSLVNYNIAIMRFEQSQGTLLEFNRISLDRAPISHYDDDMSRIRFMGKTYDMTK